FALPAALFVVVIVALMAVAMMRLITGQSVEQSRSLLATQAYWAAQGGLEWAAYQVDNLAPGTCFGPTALNVSGFNVAVSCAVTGYAEGSVSDNRFRYQVVAEASSSGLLVDDPDY